MSQYNYNFGRFADSRNENGNMNRDNCKDCVTSIFHNMSTYTPDVSGSSSFYDEKHNEYYIKNNMSYLFCEKPINQGVVWY